jgi:hypothetical protein
VPPAYVLVLVVLMVAQRRAHTDKNECVWTYGLTYSRIEEQEPTDRPHVRTNKYDVPAYGLDYVDFETRVIVRAAAGTMTAFRPEFLHGTTNGHRVQQQGVACTVSSHIVKALRASQGTCNNGTLKRELTDMNSSVLEPQYYQNIPEDVMEE